MIFFLFFLSLSLTLIMCAYGGEKVSFVLLALVLCFVFFKNKRHFAACLVSVILGLGLYFLIPKSFSGSTEVTGIVIKAEENYFLLWSFKGAFYVVEKANTREIGDVLQVSGTYKEISFAHYQESFDFKAYLESFGAYAQIGYPKIVVKAATFIRTEALKKSLLVSYSANSALVIKGLVFGDSPSSLSTYQSMRNLGVSRLFVSSGIHIGFLCSLAEKGLTKKLKEKQAKAIVLILLLGLLFLTGWSSGTVRVFIMTALALVGNKDKGNKLNYIERVCLTGSLFLLFCPLFVLRESFFLTYPPLILFGFIRGEMKKRDRGSKLRIGLVFFLLMLPFSLKDTYGLSPLSLGLQFLISPLASLLYAVDFLVFFGSLTEPFLDKLNYLAYQSSGILAKADFTFECGIIASWFLTVYYGGVVLVMLCGEYKLKKAAKAIKICLTVLVLMAFLPNLNDFYEVRFIDVGQGDATLIRYQKENILVDTGGNVSIDLATSCLIPYFKSLKIYKLDLVLTTHEDYDHVGALSSLVSAFKVDKVIKGGEEEEVSIGSLKITDLNKYRYEGEESNYSSAVYSFKLHDTSFLIMGDAPQAIEKKIVADDPGLRCDVLKLGHHGSDTSSSIDFLNTVNPKLAVISCGLNNSYGHPSKATIANLKALNIPYVRTDQDGTYVYKC